MTDACSATENSDYIQAIGLCSGQLHCICIIFGLCGRRLPAFSLNTCMVRTVVVRKIREEPNGKSLPTLSITELATDWVEKP